MASSVSTAKFVSALLINSLSISRRGYAVVASQGTVAARSGGVLAARLGKDEAENAWVPDPVTGYYRPSNRANEIDVAELRNLLIKQRVRSSSSSSSN